MPKTTWRRPHLACRGLELRLLEAALQQRDRLVVLRLPAEATVHPLDETVSPSRHAPASG